MKRHWMAAGVLGLVLAAGAAIAQTPGTRDPGLIFGQPPGDIPADFQRLSVHDDYERTEVMIPMRDGVELKTIIIRKKDAPGPHPIVLSRTPYNAAANIRSGSPSIEMLLGLDDGALVEDGFIRVFQDTRGRFGSEGTYTLAMPVRGPLNTGSVDHVTDAWDTVDWLVKNVPDNNGRVGTTGISYDGLTTLFSPIEPHPALKASVPMYPLADGWMGDDWFHGGAFRQVMFEFIYAMTTAKAGGLVGPVWGDYDLYNVFLKAGNAEGLGRMFGAQDLPAWKRFLAHPAYDAYWQGQSVPDLLRERAPADGPAVLMVNGLFDQEDIHGPRLAYQALESKDRDNDRVFLAMGPWQHGQSAGEGHQWGRFRWDADTSLQFRENVLMPFWRKHLKGRGGADPAPVVTFETGANRWREYDAWPAVEAGQGRRLYLQPNGGLAFAAPGPSGGETAYVSDPAKPVPYRLRPIRPLWGQGSTWSQWLSDDQRPFSDRTDVLTFVTEPLTEPVSIAGDPVAHLFAATTGTDADFVVKLIDVYPPEHRRDPSMSGYQFMVAGDILRGRYREGFTEGRPIEANAVLPYEVRLPAASHVFRPGHRIMVQIQSTWFPLYDRNPQTFVPNIMTADPSAYRSQTHRIAHGGTTASYIDLPVRPAR